jgi:hypothetical protein
MEGFTDGSMFIYRKSWREEGIVGVSREGELIAFLSGPLPLKMSAASLVRSQKSKFGVVIGLAFGPLVAQEICFSFCFLMYKPMQIYAQCCVHAHTLANIADGSQSLHRWLPDCQHELIQERINTQYMRRLIRRPAVRASAVPRHRRTATDL